MLEKPAERQKCRGIWLAGRAGCGKSTWAHKLGEHLGGYFEKPQNKWWDGYDKERVVVLDDLDNEALLHYLKIWSDKFPCKGEVKGSTVWLHHDWFVVTSNFTIREICEKAPNPEKFEEALQRRFHELFLPEGAQFFKFYPDCNWENPGVVEDAKSLEVEEPSQKKTPTFDPLSSWSGSGYE
nr:MAG: rep protein [Cressdnaviricota sp.]